MRRRVVCLTSGARTPVSACISALRAERFEVLERDLAAAPSTLALLGADAALIDGTTSLPAALHACREVASMLGLPVIMVVASMSESVELLCLASGARQVTTTRTPARLLGARVRAVLPLDATATDALTIGPLQLHRGARHLQCHGRGVALTAGEFLVVQALMERPRSVVERSTLIRLAWDEPCSAGALESRLSRLRAKVLGAGGPRIAVPVRGLGYRLGIEPAARR